MIERLEILFSETCLQMKAALLEFNAEDDHVHLMLSCPPKISLVVLVGKLKGKSSYFLRKEYWGHLKKKMMG